MELKYELHNGETLYHYVNEDEMEEALDKLIKKVPHEKLIEWIKEHYYDTVMEMFEVELEDELHEYFEKDAFEDAECSVTDGYATDYDRNPSMRG